MILYFSGTGNSKYVAEKLAELLNEKLVNIESCHSLPMMVDDAPLAHEALGEESLGIIFPVYAWGLPKIVADYLSNKRFVEDPLTKGSDITNKFVWTVMTCGDDMGYADVILEKVIKRTVNAAYSLQMPNTYVSLPSFDVDAPELARKKIKETEAQLPGIAESIRNKENCRKLTRGDMAWMKTYVLRPLFNKFLVTDKFFRRTQNCICVSHPSDSRFASRDLHASSCGLCAKQCPTKDIAMIAGQPVWQNNNCTGCLRCYHNCPKHAIEWGKFTKNKGQKHFQIIRFLEKNS